MLLTLCREKTGTATKKSYNESSHLMGNLAVSRLRSRLAFVTREPAVPGAVLLLHIVRQFGHDVEYEDGTMHFIGDTIKVISGPSGDSQVSEAFQLSAPRRIQLEYMFICFWQRWSVPACKADSLGCKKRTKRPLTGYLRRAPQKARTGPVSLTGWNQNLSSIVSPEKPTQADRPR